MWVAVHAELLHHPKLRRLARNLGVPKAQALGHLAALWCWCAEYAEDGDLSSFDPEEISEGAMWEGDPATFLSALERSGFVDADPDGNRSIHEWESYSGRILRAREAHREAQARYRNKSEVISRDNHGDITVISRDAPERKGKEGKGKEVEGDGRVAVVEVEGTEPPSAAAAASCSPLSETELRSLAGEFSKLESDKQGSWLASRPDVSRLVATFQNADHAYLESLGAWQPLYLADSLAKAESVWEETTGRPLNPAERAYLGDLVVSALGDMDIIDAAIRETAVSTDKPNLKLLAAIAARMADPNWEPVGAVRNVRARTPEQKWNGRVDRRRPMTVDEIV